MQFVGVSALSSLTCWGRAYLVVLLLWELAVWELRQEDGGFIHLRCLTRQQEFGGRWSAGCRQRKDGRVSDSVGDGVPHVGEEVVTEAALSSCSTFLCETRLCLRVKLPKGFTPNIYFTHFYK